jgi:hypothetical protein
VLATFEPKPRETLLEIAAYFHKLTENPELKATVQSEKIDLFGDAAVASGLHTFSFRKDGQRVELPARIHFRLPGVTTRKCSEGTTSGTLSELRPPVEIAAAAAV